MEINGKSEIIGELLEYFLHRTCVDLLSHIDP